MDVKSVTINHREGNTGISKQKHTTNPFEDSSDSDDDHDIAVKHGGPMNQQEQQERQLGGGYEGSFPSQEANNTSSSSSTPAKRNTKSGEPLDVNPQEAYSSSTVTTATSTTTTTTSSSSIHPHSPVVMDEDAATDSAVMMLDHATDEDTDHHDENQPQQEQTQEEQKENIPKEEQESPSKRNKLRRRKGYKLRRRQERGHSMARQSRLVSTLQQLQQQNENDPSNIQFSSPTKTQQAENLQLPNQQKDGNSGAITRQPAQHYHVTLRRRAIRKAPEPGEAPPPPSSKKEPPSSNATSVRNLFGAAFLVPRKVEVQQQDSTHENVDEIYDEEFGDVSLGMKLNIVAGKLIVREICPLMDGRASPAQLCGMIGRGDVLLSINGKSLVQLPLNQMMECLKPLSSPVPSSSGKQKGGGGAYLRTVDLILSTGEGLDLLDKEDEQQQKKQQPDSATQEQKSEEKSASQRPVGALSTVDPLMTLTNLIPQDFNPVDQFSGMPLIAEIPQPSQDNNDEEKDDPKEKPPPTPTSGDKDLDESSDEETSPPPQEPKTQPLLPIDARPLSTDEKISISLANANQNERDHLESGFFALNKDHSELLRPSKTVVIHPSHELEHFENRKVTMERAKQALRAAKVFSLNMEDIDKGKDLRSFKAWNTNMSIKSRASTRRRYVMDAGATLIASTIVEGEPSLAEGGSSSGGEDEMDGDELLLQMAAHDEIWRKQVLEALDKAFHEMKDDEKQQLDRKQAAANHHTNDLANLGSLFLGQHVNQLLTQKKRSFALPPDEVTSVLFDLVTNLASSTPDEISLNGKFNINPQICLLPFQKSRSSLDDDTAQATEFVVNRIFPSWLKSFRPLPWDERRVLWPQTRSLSITDSILNGSFDDGLTVDTMDPGVMTSASIRKKSLRETIEDLELDVESRSEACFLITFYFTRQMLPSLAKGTQTDNRSNNKNKIPLQLRSFTEDEVLDFIDVYGSYLKLPMSVAYCAFLNLRRVLSKLLELAKSDLRHKEATREITKMSPLLLYEPTMLSAMATKLRSLGQQKKEMQEFLVNLCVQSFPDLRPWQMREVCLVGEKEGIKKGAVDQLETLYYTYLSDLLDPSHGHDAARKDEELVKEWCTLSMKRNSKQRRSNFFRVASRKASNDYRRYKRDLVFLMTLSMQSNEYDLVLELADELLDSDVHVRNTETIESVIRDVRIIGRDCLAKQGGDPQSLKTDRIAKVFRLFEKLGELKSQPESIATTPATTTTIKKKTVFHSAHELYDLLSLYRQANVRKESIEELEFLHLMATTANPSTTLETLQFWVASTDCRDVSYFMETLQETVFRGARTDNHTALSACLLRVKKARQTFEDDSPEFVDESGLEKQKLWRSMVAGRMEMEK